MGTLLTRERIPWQVFLSFMLIPLSSIMFPHMSIMCFTAQKVTAFKKTVILYPLCIMAIWLPCVFLGALGPSQDNVRVMVAANSEPLHEWLEAAGGKNAKGEETAPELTAALHAAIAAPAKLPPTAPAPARAAAASAAKMSQSLLADVSARKVEPKQAAERLYAIKSPVVQAAWGKVASNNSDSVLLEMLKFYVPKMLAGILAAGIISAVMGSDCHQILGLSTMFTKDIFNYYGGGKRMGEHTTVVMGRAFILIVNGIAYLIALGRPPIFELAVTYAFSGFAALSPMMIAALFWKRSTKWGALACTLWVAACVGLMLYAEQHYHANAVIWKIGNTPIIALSAVGKLGVLKFSPVVPMTLGAVILTIVASLLTSPPSQATIARYFPGRNPAQEQARGYAMGAR
jgi:hypothetical protein